jgi:hypothetical protein
LTWRGPLAASRSSSVQSSCSITAWTCRWKRSLRSCRSRSARSSPDCPVTVAHRAFAFDGTVTHLGPGTTDRPGYGKLDSSGAGRPGYVAVTFTVNAWFHGGTSARVTTDMTSPATGGGGEVGPTYGIGSRLLVSGEPRWGGPALRDAIVWGCGFTRYYDAQTASTWRQAMP